MKKLALQNQIQELKKLLTEEEIKMVGSPTFDKEIREIERAYRMDVYFNEKSEDYKNDEKYDAFVKHLEDIKLLRDTEKDLQDIIDAEEREKIEKMVIKEKNKDSDLLNKVLETKVKEEEIVVEEKETEEGLKEKIELIDRLCNFFVNDMNRRWFTQIVKYKEEITKFNDKYKNYYISDESRKELNKIYAIYPEWLRSISGEEYNNIIKKYVENVKKYLENRIRKITVDSIKSYCSRKFNRYLEDIIKEVKPML